ncbi:MAG: hypothetical protein ACN2B6_00825 [Rickettsiales bacterium]
MGDVAVPDPFGIADSLDDVEGAMSGRLAQEAAEEAARIQEELAREALQRTEEAQFRLEETLAPFVGFGLQGIPQYQALFGDTVAQSISGSDVVSDLLGLADQALESNPFLAGLDPAALEASKLISGIDLLSQVRGSLLGQIQLGQASASQQAAGNLSTGAGQADLLSQIGNVQAAGIIGGNQARAQGAQNLAGIGLGLADYFTGRGD